MNSITHSFRYSFLLLILGFVLCGTNNSRGQDISGREFWFTFPMVDQLAPGEGPNLFLISDYCIDTGYIEIPGLNYKITFKIVPGQYTQVTLPQVIGGKPFYHNQVNKKDVKGIRITAPFPITAYAVTYNAASVDGETILPVDRLGTEYVGAIRGGLVQGNVRLTAVATEDSTTVIFRYWNNASGFPRRDTVKLNRGETYQVFSNRQVCSAEIPGIYANCGSLDGSHVTSDKPIAVVGSLDCACTGECGACDNLMSMPMPFSEWGNKFATAQAIPRLSPDLGASCLPDNKNSGDWYQIIGKVGTVVTINNISGTKQDTIKNVPWNAGANYGFGYLWGQNPVGTGFGNSNFGDCNMTITSSQPVQIMQYSKGWQTDNQQFTDPEAAYVYPESMWQPSYLLGTLRFASTQTSYITVVLNDVGSPLPSTTILQNGINVGAGGWVQIGTSTYKYKRIAVVPTASTQRLVSSSGYKFGVYLSSSGNAESFTYQGGQGPILSSTCPTCPIAEFTVKKTACIGETITFNDLSKANDPTGTNPIDQWHWIYGDGNTDTYTTRTNPTHVYTTPGNYTVKLRIRNRPADTTVTKPCYQEYTLKLRISDGPTVDPGKDTAICAGQSVTLGGNPTIKGGLPPYSFTWSGAGLSSTSSTNPVAKPSTTTTYDLIVADSAKCSIKKQVKVTVSPIDSAFLPAGGTICKGDSFDLVFTVNSSNTFTAKVTDGTNTYTVSNVTNGTKYRVSPAVTTDYSIVSFTGASGCQVFSPNKVKVTVRPIPSADFAGTSTMLCNGSGTELTVNFTPGGGLLQFNFTYNDSNTTKTITKPVQPYKFMVSPVKTTTYTITNAEYNDLPKCPNTTPKTFTVFVTQRGNPGLGDTITLCKNGDPVNLFTLLTNSPQTGGTWTDVNGSGGLTGSTFDPKKNTAIAAGFYRFRYTIKGTAPCPDTSTQVMVKIVTPPVFQNITDKDNCAADLQSYKVKAEVTGGDNTSYSSPEGTITLTGGKYLFTSTATFPNKTSYTITVDDNNKCGPTSFTGYVNCGCKTSAGKMKTETYDFCETETAVVPDRTNSNKLPGDTMIYILHQGTGPSIVGEKARSFTPQFAYDPSYSYGTTYYISSVAGPSTGTGPDFTSDCISISPGTPVRWFKQVTATLSGNQSICNGDSTRLDIQFTGEQPFSATVNGITYPGLADKAAITVTPSATTSYSLDSISDKHCRNNQQVPPVTVVVNNAPVKVAGSESFVCNSTATAYIYSFDITGGDPATYSVTAGTGSISGNTYTSPAVPSGNSISVSIDDQNGCGPLTDQNSYSCPCVTSIGNLLPATQSVCEGNPAVLNSISFVPDGDDEIRYLVHSNPADPVSPDPILVTIDTVIPFQAGMTYGTTYYVTAVAASRDGNGSVSYKTDPCRKFSNTVSIVFNQNPTATLTAVSPICENQTSTLSVTPSQTGSFQVEFNRGSSPAPESPATITSSNRTITVSPGSTTTYTLTKITNLTTGCSATLNGQAVPVQVNTAPTATVSTPLATICQKDQGVVTVTFTGIPPYSFVLTDQMNYSKSFSNVMQNTVTENVPTNVGYNNFQVTNFSDKGCPGVNSNTVSILVNPDPTASVSAPPSICDGDPLTLTFNFTGNGGPYNIRYNDAAGLQMLSGLNNGSTASARYSRALNTFPVTYVQDVSTGCYNDKISGRDSTMVHDLPTAALGSSKEICEGQSVSLDLVMTGSGNITVTINDQDSATPAISYTNTAGTHAVQLNGLTAGDHTYTISSVSDDNCNNSGTGTSIVSVKTAPDVNFVVADSKGCSPVLATFTNTTNFANPKECLWDMGDGTVIDNCGSFTHLYDRIGTYSVSLKITSTSGCWDDTLATDIVEILPDPVADFTFTPKEPTLTDPVVNFSNSSRYSAGYLWTFDALGTSTATHPQFEFPNDTDAVYLITLTAYSAYGCSDVMTKPIRIKGDLLAFAPNSFTPNGDGANDIFIPVFDGNRDDIKSYELLIFNRWGEVLFHSKDLDRGWDGTYKGEKMPAGTYPYRILVRSKYDAYAREIPGALNLIR